MPDQSNAVCSVCGKSYRLCNSCASAQSFTGWRRLADTANCYKIFITLQQYNNKHITQEAARARLSSLDLTQLDNFVPYIRQTIESILQT